MGELFRVFEAGFTFSVVAAVVAAPLAVAVLVIDLSLGKRIAPRCQSLLWTLVVIRLLMPFAPESSLGLPNLWQWVNNHRVVPYEPVWAGSEEATPLAKVHRAETSILRERARAAQADRQRATVQSAHVSPWAWWTSLLDLLSVLWIAGVTVVFGRASVASLRFWLRIRCIPNDGDPTVITMLRRVCDELSVRRCPSVKYVPEISAPALFGMFRPTLCVPAEARMDLSDDQLRMIMIHEVAHLRGRDMYLSWLLTLVQAVHWFHPIAWFAGRRIATYRELACDETVRQYTASSDRRVYMDLLIRFATQRQTASLGLVGMWFAQPDRRLAARLNAFSAKAIRRPRLPRLAAGMLFILVAIVGLTDAARSNTEKSGSQHASASPVADWMARATPATILQDADFNENNEAGERIEEREYNVSKALEKLAGANPNVDAMQWLLVYLRPPFVSPITVLESDPERGQLRLRMTRRAHKYFADILEGLSRSGPWQIAVATQVWNVPQAEMLGDIDWDSAIHFPLPSTADSTKWPEQSELDNGKKMTSSVESTSREYAPYLAVVIDREQLQSVIYRLHDHPKATVWQAPKITVFNGIEATIRDESCSPFVVGVRSIKGDTGVAYQPEVAVLTAGAKVEVLPEVIDTDTLDLRCRLTVSAVHSVGEAKLPGMGVTVQTPNESRRIISAGCHLAPGQALLIAPLVSNNAGDHGALTCYAFTAEWWPDAELFGKLKSPQTILDEWTHTMLTSAPNSSRSSTD